MMFFIEPGFDFNDHLANKYLKYCDEYYDIGTKVRIRTWNGVEDAIFVGWNENNGPFEIKDVYLLNSKEYVPCRAKSFVVEIIEPVYPDLTMQNVNIKKNNLPKLWEIEVELIWYIIVMIGGLIFKDFWILWIGATIIFLARIFGTFKKINKNE
jgi:hypothetical protein